MQAHALQSNKRKILPQFVTKLSPALTTSACVGQIRSFLELMPRPGKCPANLYATARVSNKSGKFVEAASAALPVSTECVCLQSAQTLTILHF